MIMVKRLSQPPALSWHVWDTDMPGSVLHVKMHPDDYQAAKRHDVRILQAAVRDLLAEAGRTVLVRNAELREL